MSESSTVVLCAHPGCGKPAGKLQCPYCQKEGKPASESSFCSQDCFKLFWPKHKTSHNIKPAFNPWPNFKFTGKLRPYPYGPKRTIPEGVEKPDYADTGVPKSELDYKRNNTIPVHGEEEIRKMRKVCRMAREVLDAAARAIKPGVTTDELDRIVHEETVKRCAYPSPLNYVGFPKSCCTSVNEVICHGIPDTRPLEAGDLVNIDVTLFYDGFHGDLNETYCVGEVDKKGLELINCSRTCLEKALEIVHPGTAYKEIGAIIEKHAKSCGFSVVKTYCGHGIGRLFHTVPNVPHYAKNKTVGIMRPGHIFTIEPMINEGAWQDLSWPDEWTAVTIDGKRSAQFEHTILVTEDGYELLTAALPDSPSAPRL